jgi:NADH:ubiquinone oxidoreductase subunit F (NADH-binding)
MPSALARPRSHARSRPAPQPAGGLPRLLARGAEDSPASLDAHHAVFGALPPVRGRRERDALLAELAASGLRGRGGGAFTTGTKLRAVAEQRGRSIVVANGTEGEPLSRKDRMLVRTRPHLVLDGMVAAARAVAASEAILVLSRSSAVELASACEALDQRDASADAVALRVEAAPERFITGEESALVRWLGGGPAKPTLRPPRPSEKGVRGRPTLVQNVETLAHLALIARHGAGWFRTAGTAEEPGTMLVTLAGAVERAGVCEVELGTPLGGLLERAGAAPGARAVLVGGYFGSWLAAPLGDVRLSSHSLREVGCGLGAGSLFVLGEAQCPLAETARVVHFLATQGAGQCGPCVFGLPAIADAAADLARRRDPAQAMQRLGALPGLVERRGACAHPDGVARLVRSTLAAFPDEIERHLRGNCSATDHAPVLPIPATAKEWR